MSTCRRLPSRYAISTPRPDADWPTHVRTTPSNPIDTLPCLNPFSFTADTSSIASIGIFRFAHPKCTWRWLAVTRVRNTENAAPATAMKVANSVSTAAAARRGAGAPNNTEPATSSPAPPNATAKITETTNAARETTFSRHTTASPGRMYCAA